MFGRNQVNRRKEQLEHSTKKSTPNEAAHVPFFSICLFLTGESSLDVEDPVALSTLSLSDVSHFSSSTSVLPWNMGIQWVKSS